MKKLLIDVSVLKSDRYVIGFWASDAELIWQERDFISSRRARKRKL